MTRARGGRRRWSSSSLLTLPLVTAEDPRRRRDRVLRLPALAGLRPRPRLRERVPPLLRARPGGAGRVQGDVPRPARAAHRPAHQLRAAGLGAPVVAVLPARPRRRARRARRWDRRWPRTASRAPYVAAACYASALYGFLGLLLVHDAPAALRRPSTTPAAAGRWPRCSWATPAPLLHDPGARLLPRRVAVRGGRARSGCRCGRVRGAAAARWVAAWGPRAASPRWCASRTCCSWPCPPACSPGGRAARGRWRRGRARVARWSWAPRSWSSLPQLLAYRAINGAFGPSRLVTRKMSYASPHFLEVLFDPGHGLFVWAPVLLVATVGARLRPRARGATRWRRRCCWPSCSRCGSTAPWRAGPRPAPSARGASWARPRSSPGAWRRSLAACARALGAVPRGRGRWRSSCGGTSRSWCSSACVSWTASGWNGRGWP